jgi:hypothetical protein
MSIIVVVVVVVVGFFCCFLAGFVSGTPQISKLSFLNIFFAFIDSLDLIDRSTKTLNLTVKLKLLLFLKQNPNPANPQESTINDGIKA